MTSDSELKLGEWTVQPALNTLRRGDTQVRVEPRYMDLLLHLARHPGEVISAEAILEEVWSGQVVGDHSVYQGIARLRKALGDNSQNPHYIETVAKRGYRLIAPLQRQDPGTDDLSAGAPPPAPIREPGKHQPGARVPGSRLARLGVGHWTLAFALVSAALAVGYLWFGLSVDPQPAYRTVAVMPFDNLSQDEDNVYFAEGLAAELIGALGGLEGLKVLGQTSSFSFRNGQKGAAEVGRILGADALVEGSVRRADERLRIFIQVIEARTGYQIWSQTYERNLIDVFEIQEDIARHVAESLRGRIEGAELSRLTPAPPVSIEAYDYYLLGQYYRSTRSVSGLNRALKMYRKANAIDPDYAPAYRGIGASHLLLSYYGHLSLARALELAEPALDKALELDPADAETAGSLGLARHMQGEYGLAEHYLDQALDIKPNYAEGWMWRGLAVEKQGRLKEAQADFDQALLLEPLMVPVAVNHAIALARLGERDRAIASLEALATPELESPQLYRRLSILALANGDLAAAYRWSDAALELRSGEASSRAMKALILAYLGQTEQALEWSDRALSDGFPGQHTRELLELVYLSTGQGARLDRLADIESKRFANGTAPAIEWRRSNAHAGNAALLLGRIEEAAAALEKALNGSTYAVVSTDFDLIYCTSLAFAYAQTEDAGKAREWTRRCRESLEDAHDQGWKSHWMLYAAARLATLSGDTETGLAALDRLLSGGFRGFEVIAKDPVFQPLRDDPRLLDSLASLRADAETTWAKISP